MNKKALLKVFEEIVANYKESAWVVIKEHALNQQEELSCLERVDKKIKNWEKRLQRLTDAKLD